MNTHIFWCALEITCCIEEDDLQCLPSSLCFKMTSVSEFQEGIMIAFIHILKKFKLLKFLKRIVLFVSLSSHVESLLVLGKTILKVKLVMKRQHHVASVGISLLPVCSFLLIFFDEDCSCLQLSSDQLAT